MPLASWADVTPGPVVTSVVHGPASRSTRYPSSLIELSVHVIRTLPDAVLTASGSVRITWTDNSINEDGFRVERDAGPWTTLVTTGPGVTSAQDASGIPNQERVCYRVVAFNKAGDAAPSNTD